MVDYRVGTVATAGGWPVCGGVSLWRWEKIQMVTKMARTAAVMEIISVGPQRRSETAWMERLNSGMFD